MTTKSYLLTVLSVCAASVFITNITTAESAAESAADSAAESAADSETTWMTDFDAAKAKAKAEGKPLLVNFTGSDWCGWCIKLVDEVFSQKAFQEYADKSLVLVEIDFPRRKEISAELKAQNEALAKTYGIRGFPTILVMDADAKVLKSTGYRRGGAEAYVSHIKQILANK